MLKELFGDERSESFTDIIGYEFLSKNPDKLKWMSHKKGISDYINNIVEKYDGTIKMDLINGPIDVFINSITKVNSEDTLNEFKKTTLLSLEDSEDYGFFRRIVNFVENVNTLDISIEHFCVLMGSMLAEIKLAVVKSDKCSF